MAHAEGRAYRPWRQLWVSYQDSKKEAKKEPRSLKRGRSDKNISLGYKWQYLSMCQNKRFNILGRRGIAPTRNCTHLLKNVLNLFIFIKLTFFLIIFLSLSYLFPHGGYNRNKTRPGEHKSNFKKVYKFRMGAISS